MSDLDGPKAYGLPHPESTRVGRAGVTVDLLAFILVDLRLTNA